MSDTIKVLLVEDDPGDIKLTREALADGLIAIDLSVVRNGVEALEFLRQQGRFADSPLPDLVLLDLNMPRMSGSEALREIRRDDKLKDLAVAVLTTSAAEEDVVASFERGANYYISKPAGFEDFNKVSTLIQEFWDKELASRRDAQDAGGKTSEP